MITGRYLKEEYISRVNRVIDFIKSNLDQDLKLEAFARIANFSPYHFHRIFKLVTGESLNRYIKRQRLEKAAHMLAADLKTTITKIAYECGFNTSASFSRAFRDHFKISPGEWRESALNTIYKNSIYGKNISTDSGRKVKPTNIDIRDLPDTTVAYIRYSGIYEQAVVKQLIKKLSRWASVRDLLHFPETKIFQIFHSAPGVTEPETVTISICITIPDNMSVEGEIGKKLLSGGKYAIGHFEISGNEYINAWEYMIYEWLPESGYGLDMNPFFEQYLNDPEDHPGRKHIVDIHVPVRPA